MPLRVAAVEPPAAAGPQRRMGVISWACAAMAVVAVGFAAWAARDVLAPIAVAGVIAIMLAPVSAQLERRGAPPLLAALALVGLGVAAAAAVIVLAAPDAARLARQLPATIAAVETRLEEVRAALAPLTDVGVRVQEAATLTSIPADGEEAPWPVVMQQNAGNWLFSGLSSIGGAAVQIGFSIVLTLFMVAERRRIRAFVMKAAPNNAARRRLAAMMLDIRTRVSRFLLAQTLSNLGLAAASATALMVIGFPAALMWGGAVFLGNFIPYAGGFAVQAACLAYGLATFEDWRQALLAPGLLWALNFIEGQFVTPWVVGRHVVISPLAVLLAVGFGGWVWGAVGALVAVPALIVGASALQHWWRPVGTRPGRLRLQPRRRVYRHGLARLQAAELAAVR
jgi:predicted PurR-regulated permease PerM